MKLPGTRLLGLAKLVVDPPTVARVLEPLVADWQREWLSAPSPLHRLLVSTRGILAFFSSAAYCFLAESPPPAQRMLAWTTMLAFLGLGLSVQSVSIVPGWFGMLWLPGSLATSAALTMLPLGIRLGASEDRERARRHLMRLALVMTIVVVVMTNWGTPYASRGILSWIVAVEPVQLGRRVVTLPQLLSLDPRNINFYKPPAVQVREEPHHRATLALMPGVLAIMSWSLAHVSRSSHATRLAFWWLFVTVTFLFARGLGSTLGHAWNLPREVGLWLPLMLWGLASATLMLWPFGQRERARA